MLAINSGDMIDAIRIVGLVPPRAGIASSEFLRLSASKGELSLSLSADVFGTVKITAKEGKDDWEAYADRASFVPFVLASKEYGTKASFKFDYKSSGVLTVRCGRRKATLNSTSVSGYTEVGKVKGAKLNLSPEQCRLIRFASSYATPDPTVANLNCVYVKKDGTVLASNEKAAIRLMVKAPEVDLPIPLGILASLDNDSVKSLTLGDKLAKISFANGYVCQTVNQKAVKDFPKRLIESAMKTARKYKLWFRVDSQKLSAAMGRLNLYSAMVVKRDAVVTLSGSKGDKKIRLTCAVPQGEFSEEISIKSTLKKDISVHWLLQLMQPLVQISGGVDTLSVRYEVDASTPYLITGQEFDLLVSRRAK